MTFAQQASYVDAADGPPRGIRRRLPVETPLYLRPIGRLYHGVPESLLLTLVETYFDNVYNAHLLLHKRSFLESLEAGVARTHVVLGVCALGAKYGCRGCRGLW